MPYEKAPSKDTYQTDSVKLIWTLFNRDSSLAKDPLLKNGFYEVVSEKDSKDNDYYVVRRDGCTAYPWVCPSSTMRGMFYWEDKDKLFVSYNDKIAIITASNGIEETTVTPFTTTSGEVSFTEFYYEDGTSKVVVGDGTTLITIDASNVVVTCTDPDIPSPFVPNLVYLDGYLFIIKANTADIYNSDLNDPLAWTPGNFLSAEMLPDTLIRLSRLNNYLIAFGSSSVEYFFDAGNASGSPLQRNDTPVKQIGYLGGFATFGNKVIFVGQFANTVPEVYILEDFKVDEISTPQVRRMFQEVRDFSASLVSNGGRDFYVLTFDSKTLALDLDTKMWYQWSFGATSTFDIRNAISIYLSNGYSSLFSVQGGATIYFFSREEGTDQGALIEFEGVSQRLYFDTGRRKFMSKVAVIADKVNENLQLSWTDDDYQTYSTARTISLNTQYPKTHRLGSFYSRAFKFRYTGVSAIRLHHLEVDYNLGIK